MDFEDTLPRAEPSPMPAAIDVRKGIENQRQKAMVAAALFGDPAPPIKIGRFTIVRELGAGGMGVVYVAYDEQLDRRVAVKLLRHADEADEEAQPRLEREAQAMARLSHPNVVTVHEVGTFEDQVFVAMEFVAGRDLRAWLSHEEARDQARDWRETLAIFLQAGEGLAAAHEAGIVHRDFKPDNVLVGDDGRVRVADFGLAHGRGVGVSDTELDPLGESSGKLELRLTATGAMMGTPAYMAPEQFEGASTDERSDQFSFCVALWEALYGARPFAGRNLVALAASVAKGQLPEPAPNSPIPSWLRPILARGLAVEPDQRWPSMRALLSALANDPHARRRRIVGFTSLAGLAGLAILGLSWLAAGAVAENAQQRYWSALTSDLDAIEDLARTRLGRERARDGARLDAVARHQPRLASEIREDPTASAALLREVEGDARTSSRWVSAANNALLDSVALEVLDEHTDIVVGLAFDGEGALISASHDKTVRRWTPSTATSEVLYAHQEAIAALALAPDGRSVATASADDRVGLWQPERGLRWLEGHGDDVEALAFSPDGQLLGSASRDRSARIWPVEGGDPLVLEGHDKRVLSLDFDPASTRVATGSADATVRVWDARSGQLLHTLRGHTRPVYHLHFVDTDRLVSASDDGSARSWSLGDNDEPGTILVQHEDAITSLASFDGQHFSTTGSDETTRLWRLEGGEVEILRGHHDSVWHGVYARDGQRVVSVSFDGTARVSAPEARATPRILRGQNTYLTRAALDETGRLLATGAWDGSIRIWDLAREPGRMSLPHPNDVQRVVFDARGDRLLSVSDDGDARVWRASDGTLLATLTGDEPLDAAAFSPDGSLLATGSVQGRVRLWAGPDYQLHELGSTGDWVWDLAFGPRGQRLLTSSEAGSLWLWDTQSATARTTNSPGQGQAIAHAIVDPSSERLLTAGQDGVLRTWTLDGVLIRELPAHDEGVVALIASPEGRRLATSSPDGSVKLWRMEPDRPPRDPIELRGHTMTVPALAFSPDGERLASASLDHSVKIWRSDDGRELETFAGHGGEVWDLSFSRSGRALYTASDNGTLRRWSFADQPPIVLRGHDEAIVDLALSPDGTQLATASLDNHAILWQLDQLDAEPDALVDRLELATHHCLDADARIEALGEDEAEADAAAAACERQRQRHQ